MPTTRTMQATRAPGPAVELSFAIGDLRRVRGVVADLCHRAGLDGGRTDNITVAVNELVANSVDHGGGRGTLRGWVDDAALVIEVQDAGHIPDPVRAGRARPRTDQVRGRGLWIVRRLTDSLDIRPTPDGTVFRVLAWR